MTEYWVCHVAAVPEGAFLVAAVGGTEVGVTRVCGEVVAFENRCPHQAGPVCLGEVVGRREAMLDGDNRLVGECFSTERFDAVCPWHGFAFDAVTGENICDRRLRLRRWDVAIRDGDVFVSHGGR